MAEICGENLRLGELAAIILEYSTQQAHSSPAYLLSVVKSYLQKDNEVKKAEKLFKNSS